MQHILEQQDIALLNVPTVFTQVHGDAIGPRLFRVQRRLDRIRVARATSLTQGGDVVDVHAKKNAIAGGHGCALLKKKIRRTAYTVKGLFTSGRGGNGMLAECRARREERSLVAPNEFRATRPCAQPAPVAPRPDVNRPLGLAKQLATDERATAQVNSQCLTHQALGGGERAVGGPVGFGHGQ
ncbi:hypothetical protein D3C85_1136000 [compost metagenome]